MLTGQPIPDGRYASFSATDCFRGRPADHAAQPLIDAIFQQITALGRMLQPFRIATHCPPILILSANADGPGRNHGLTICNKVHFIASDSG
jgi:hypothetical protein